METLVNISTIIGGVGGFIGFFVALRANKISKLSNEISSEANYLAKKANNLTINQLELEIRLKVISVEYVTIFQQYIPLNTDRTKLFEYRIFKRFELSIKPLVIKGTHQAIFIKNVFNPLILPDQPILLKADTEEKILVDINTKYDIAYTIIVYFPLNGNHDYDVIVSWIEPKDEIELVTECSLPEYSLKNANLNYVKIDSETGYPLYVKNNEMQFEIFSQEELIAESNYTMRMNKLRKNNKNLLDLNFKGPLEIRNMATDMIADIKSRYNY